ncbi:hypothetical protein [Kribbia dieselivorans]|uniref:hypothetical protein n=1 Tax=Kribbia dieselivorans TaxID=331526 RepID=UPI00083932A2|nr:hypothetical protein [Kribbia dieselivorans]
MHDFAHDAREMLYASITGVAALVTLYVYVDQVTGRAAAGSLVTTMWGLFLASLVADTIVHVPKEDGPPEPTVMRRVLRVAGRALEVSVLPTVILLLADTGLWSVRTALILAIVTLTVTQLIIVLLSQRGADTTPWQKLWYLVLQSAAIAAVVLFKVLVH